MFASISDRKFVITTLLLICLAIAGVMGYRWYVMRQAHASFQGYYDYAGCVKLYTQSDTAGVCQNASGQIINIRQQDGKWYSDGDRPE